MGTAQVSIIDECIKQLWDIDTMEHYSAIKKKKSIFCNKIDGPGKFHAK